MSFTTRMLRQKATYWAPPAGQQSAYDGPTFAAPVTIKTRWEDKSVAFQDDSGVEHKSNSVVYVDRTLVVEGFLLLGISSSTDPSLVSGAKEIKKFEEYPTVHARQFERKVLL